MKKFIVVLFSAGVLLFGFGYFFYMGKPDIQLRQMVVGIGVMIGAIGYKYVIGMGEDK